MCVTPVPAKEATTIPSPLPPVADDDVATAVGPDGAASSGPLLFFVPPLFLFVVVATSVAVDVAAVGRGEATRFGSAPSRRTIHT